MSFYSCWVYPVTALAAPKPSCRSIRHPETFKTPHNCSLPDSSSTETLVRSLRTVSLMNITYYLTTTLKLIYSCRQQISHVLKKVLWGNFTASTQLTQKPYMTGLMLGRMRLGTAIHMCPPTKILSLVSMMIHAHSIKIYILMSRLVNHGSMHASTTTLLTIKSWLHSSKSRTRTSQRIISMIAVNIYSSLSMTPAFF
jgi:hypothetical protein